MRCGSGGSRSDAAPRFEQCAFCEAECHPRIPERVFGFNELPDALNRLTPPWEPTRVVYAATDLRVGSLALIETRLFGLLPVRWVAQHTAYDPPRMFEDVQVEGPFKSWRHRHFVEPHEKDALLRDEVEYETPLGVLGRLAAPRRS